MSSKDKVTNFDIYAAFRALDEIDYPEVEGVAQAAPSVETLFEGYENNYLESLTEEFYSLDDQEDLEDAAVDRDAEINAAKLAKIEKIVDLDAKSVDELQPSYVGKYIIQCPQCMTLFYKDEADLVKDENDETLVNVGEACQHCGHDSGYTLIGKVDAVEEEVPAEETPAEEAPAEETMEEVPTEEQPAEETPAEEEAPAEGEEELDLDNLNLNLESLNKSKAAPSENETENKSENLTLNEELDDDELLDDFFNHDSNPFDNSIEFNSQLDENNEDIYEESINKAKIDANTIPENASENKSINEANKACDESLNNSEVQKDAEKNSELATENKSENISINESIDDIDLPRLESSKIVGIIDNSGSLYWHQKQDKIKERASKDRCDMLIYFNTDIGKDYETATQSNRIDYTKLADLAKKYPNIKFIFYTDDDFEYYHGDVVLDNIANIKVVRVDLDGTLDKPLANNESLNEGRTKGESEEVDYTTQHIDDALYYINDLGYFDFFNSTAKEDAEETLKQFPEYIKNKKHGKAVGKELEIVELPDGIRVQVKGMKINEDLSLTEGPLNFIRNKMDQHKTNKELSNIDDMLKVNNNVSALNKYKVVLLAVENGKPSVIGLADKEYTDFANAQAAAQNYSKGIKVNDKECRAAVILDPTNAEVVNINKDNVNTSQWSNKALVMFNNGQLTNGSKTKLDKLKADYDVKIAQQKELKKSQDAIDKANKNQDKQDQQIDQTSTQDVENNEANTTVDLDSENNAGSNGNVNIELTPDEINALRRSNVGRAIKDKLPPLNASNESEVEITGEPLTEDVDDNHLEANLESDREISKTTYDKEPDMKISDAEMNEIIDTYGDAPISEEEVQDNIDEIDGTFDEDYNLDDIDDFDEASFEECATNSLKDVYENVNNFKVNEISLEEGKLNITGTITFNSGNTKPTLFKFNEAKVNSKNKNLIRLIGLNPTTNCTRIELDTLKESNNLSSEKLSYRYRINEQLVEGLSSRK